MPQQRIGGQGAGIERHRAAVRVPQVQVQVQVQASGDPAVLPHGDQGIGTDVPGALARSSFMDSTPGVQL
ncbi:hypothetical protein [Streptomyces rapamycinicus]|uniref:Uncharacterized protein n=1 Tax=Streptomyces rapamycinicus TaxID=1226757 RepID=A0ABR6LQU7_9ACTN|nr:hypothetical protein [Streptomyces rapamycinicus]AGP56350.1 hypothetical protein M271_24280 [Streptomyces rapamycinicus NRRL 5491]MBB4783948.1 hypothetical protein [Streptomyces rapamycinicus]UTO64304.1 hypothetical protein LJB45_19555 [Streptomyces rapamycinicus]UTP32259.1 hypothetical protein LIV37_24680 [Streptomyces rapamycinicus NRRL 5491]